MRPAGTDTLQRHITSWKLEADGEPFQSVSSWLQPVRLDGEPAFLKVPFEPEERAAIPVLSWFGEKAAACIALGRQRTAHRTVSQ